MNAGIVPACGASVRMGRPKLLLPIGGVPLIRRVVEALRRGGVERVVVVTADEAELAGADRIADEAARAGGHVVRLRPRAADMRGSIEAGIARLASVAPRPARVVIAPGDTPGLDAGVVARVLEAARQEPSRLVVAAHLGRRGHPLVLPWMLAAEVADLPAGVGVNALLARHAERIRLVESGGPEALADLDTPEQYAAWTSAPRGASDLPDPGAEL